MKFIDLVRYKTVICVRKALSNSLPQNIQAKFELNDKNTHILRSSGQFKVCYSRTNLKHSCISVRGILQYNSLPIHVKAARTFIRFKSLLKQEISNEYKRLL